MHPKRLILARWAGLSILCAVGAVEGAPSIAAAQWLPDRNYTEGPGIRVGNLELHPGVAVRGGYDTNVFRSQKSSQVGAAVLAVSPHINISTLTRQRLTEGEDAMGGQSAPLSRPIAFNLGLSTTFFHMFLENTPTNMEVDTDGALAIRPDAPVGFDIGLRYARGIRPFTEFTGRDANNEYGRNRILPSARLRAQSRSGVFKATIGYAPELNIFESSTFDYLNSISHNVQVGTSWRFLPYTAIVADAAVGFSDYFDSVTPNSTVLVSNSTRFNTRLGLNGNLTRRLSLRVLAGYVLEQFDDPALDDMENVVGEAILGFASPQYSVEGGYQRNVASSAIGGWSSIDRGMIRATMIVARVLSLGLEAGAGKAGYGRIVGVDATTGARSAIGIDRETGLDTFAREDVRADGSFHAEYRVTNWLALLADFAVLATFTDFQYKRGEGITPDPAEFISYQAFGGVRLHY